MRSAPLSAGPRHRWPWLLFLHQLPSAPSNARVRTWRRLQQLGAVPLRNAAYVLPDTPEAREDFEWLASEIKALGGEATVVAAGVLAERDAKELMATFRAARRREYDDLAEDISRWERSRPPRGRPPRLLRALRGFRARLVQIEALDFFAPGGGRRIRDRLAVLEKRLRPRQAPDARLDAVESRPRGATWVTRPRPGVDRMASAWLIRRFIDPAATFAFADTPPATGVPFDMFGVEFGHQGGRCTYEVLAQRFEIPDPAARWIGEIVHDVDLKDHRFGRPEAAVVGALVEGLRRSIANDDVLLERGMGLFEALFRAPASRDAAASSSRRTRTKTGRRV